MVTRHDPPFVKTWETVGNPELLVVGYYRMDIEIEPKDASSLLRVSIDYDLPATNAWLGQLFSGMYAKWCVAQMLNGAREYFKRKSVAERQVETERS